MTLSFLKSSILWSESDNSASCTMESFLNDETEDDGSLLNQASVGAFSVIAKALHRTGS